VDPRLRDYLIRAHNKVVAHYHRVLKAGSLAQLERERIHRGLASIEAELDTLITDGLSPSRVAVRLHEASPGVAPGSEFFV